MFSELSFYVKFYRINRRELQLLYDYISRKQPIRDYNDGSICLTLKQKINDSDVEVTMRDEKNILQFLNNQKRLE